MNTYQTVFDSSPNKIAVFDEDAKVELINPTLEHFLGATSDEIHGRRSSDIFRGEQAHLLETAIQNVAVSGENAVVEMPIEGPEGRPIPHIFKLSADVSETGAATRTASSQPATLLPGSSGSSTATTPQQPRTATPTPAPAAAPSPERLAAVRAITKPETDDPGDDDYSYGFRLWEAEFYPEAQQALAKFVEDYPNHSRTSYGRNLLGRAFLDNGQPYEAAPWFLQNYRADSSGARAPDSLLYLARAMQQLSTMSNAPALDAGTPTYGERACIALAQLSEEYPAIAAGRLSTEYEATRRTLDCGG